MSRLLSRLADYFLSPTRRHNHAERKLVRKIDFFILTFCCFSYFLNYLDRTNINNAYVSGMKEDLNFQGDQLNQINTCFTIGYILGQIPSNLSLHYVKPRYFFPAMMVLWAGLTMLTASTHSPQAIMAIRFFQGVAESSTFVGTHYILGSWYTERELGKRSGVFTASGLAGTMIGGFIQSGIHATMDGRHGLRGWRWLFLIDGIITLPVAVYGFLLFPDTPATTTACYLTPSERELAVSRLNLANDATTPSPNGDDDDDDDHPDRDRHPEATTTTTTTGNPAPRPRPPSPLTLPFLKSVLTSWEWWGFVTLWILAGEAESFSTNALLALHMKQSPLRGGDARPYTVRQLNDYPTGVPAVGIASTLFWAALTDRLGGRRYLVGYFVGVTGVATSAMILGAERMARDLLEGDEGPAGGGASGSGSGSGSGRVAGMVFGAYYWAGAVYACQATFFAWANDATREREPVFRSVVLAGMNVGSNAVNAWWSIVFYGASMAPWFTRGMYAMIATSVALMLWTAGLSYVAARARRSRHESTSTTSAAEVIEKAQNST